MKLLEKKEANASLADYVDQVSQDTIVVTVNGKPVAALMSLEDTDFETISLSTNPQFLAIIERSRLRHKLEGGVPSEEVRRIFQARRRSNVTAQAVILSGAKNLLRPGRRPFASLGIFELRSEPALSITKG